MTDKEIIEIDGINVLECEHYQYKSLKDCEMRYPESGDCEIGLLNYLFNGNLDIEKFCKDNPNCYFKQLTRKTQECEQKEKELLSNEKIINKLMKEVDELKQECEEYKKRAVCFKDVNKQLGYKYLTIKQECEELKERLVRTEEDLKYQCVDCMNVKSDRYRKALEKIEKYCNYKFCDKFGEFTELINKNSILDIINKAKDGNNEQLSMPRMRND